MLKLENISKYYYSSSNVTCALRKINLEFKVGEFVAITGESGSGKTTLLNLISGLDTYEDGEMYYYDKKTSFFDDADWEKYRKEEIGFIFQNYNLIDSYTVLENVMVTYIIDGYSYKEAKVKAKEKLKLVGLEKDSHKKAIKLSGGQKQRLAIARVLAKETNIIVADEPTGNLDVENGNQVLSILKELSKDKLVIVVTHNQGQVEPFVTRKIRLRDGEITSDEIVEQIVEKEVKAKEEKQYNKVKQLFEFSFLNIKSQPKKSILLIIFILFATLASFVFLSNFKMNIDDNKTKLLTNDLFTNFDDTRLIVRRKDNAAITQDEFSKIKIDNVVGIEQYDHITDMNYFREEDYRWRFDGGFQDSNQSGGGGASFVDSSSIILVNHDKFMRSASSLTLDMLSHGCLPTGKFEMVVYSDDPNILNTTEKVLFQNSKVFGIDTWYSYDVKIVGILKEPTKQAYFSETICKIMDMTQFKVSFNVKLRDNRTYREQSYTIQRVVVDPNLTDNKFSLDTGRANAASSKIVYPEVYYSVLQQWMSLQFNYSGHTVNDNALGVTEETFNIIYDACIKSGQVAIFINDYAYIEDVRNELADLGYNSISCYQASVAGWDTEKVIVRYINLGISLIALAVINLVTVLLAFAILKVKKNDYVIFKMIGLSNKDCKRINYIEVIFYGILCNIILIIISTVISNVVKTPLIVEVYKYIRFTDYLLIFVIIIFSMIMLGRKFGKFLTNKARITVLKEE